ncbi:MAG TPA: FAD-dependent oxidoreductase [Polyangiaceae bacterium]|nr:FAD-dependent oxidoreductase [Polyangiaceae bacterium]
MTAGEHGGGRHIGIIGAGVAGLTVAYRRTLAGDRVSVFEAAPHVGGQLSTERSGGFVVEQGAEGFVSGSQALADLAASLGIGSHLLDQDVTVSCTFDGQTLRRLAPGEAGRLLGFQVGERAFGKGIQSFLGGMLELAEVLRDALGPASSCRSSTPIASVRPNGARWQIVTASGDTVDVDRVVVATSALAAAPLLAPVFGAPAAALSSSAASSSVTVSLAYPRPAIAHALDATGFVVAEGAQSEGFRACTFASSKLRGRAPAEHALLRAFFRPSGDDLERLGDDAWAERAHRSLQRAFELRSLPERTWVSRWARALPVFDDAYRARIAALEASLAGSGVSVSGACFHGSGIDAAVRSAEAAARALDH